MLAVDKVTPRERVPILPLAPLSPRIPDLSAAAAKLAAVEVLVVLVATVRAVVTDWPPVEQRANARFSRLSFAEDAAVRLVVGQKVVNPAPAEAVSSW